MPDESRPTEHLASVLAKQRVWELVSTADRNALEPLFQCEAITGPAVLLPQGQLHTHMGLIDSHTDW